MATTPLPPLSWGVLGTGGIARKFAGQLRLVEHGQVVAVGSRSGQTAEAFTAEYGGTPWDSYQQVLDDPRVEAVYLSLPNALHCEWTLRALASGKHVLCEKPLASNATEAEKMFAAAARYQRVLIEAFMYRCHPAVERFLELAHNGAVGEIRLVRSNFTFNRPAHPADIRYQADLAGGALMDVGCYPINFTRALARSEPTSACAVMHRHEGGVDDYAVGCLEFAEAGILSTFTCGMCVSGDRTTCVAGSEGYLTIDMPWNSTGALRLLRGRAASQMQVEEMQVGAQVDLYALEAKRFAAVVRGEAEPWITAADTLGNMRVLDQLRQTV